MLIFNISLKLNYPKFSDSCSVTYFAFIGLNYSIPQNNLYQGV